MADADLDVIIRQTAKQQNKVLMAAVKARRDRFVGLAAKAKDKTGKDRLKQLAKDVVEQGTAAARRLQMSADNAADSYARSMRKAAEALDAKKDEAPAVKKASADKPKTGNSKTGNSKTDKPVAKKTAPAKKAGKTKKNA